MLTKQDIFRILHEHRSRLVELGVKRVGLFGSFAQGTPHPKSDINLLVEFDAEQKTFNHYMELSFFLEDLFKRRVELVTPEALSPYLGPHILKEVEYVDLAA